MLKDVGFVISHKSGETRRAILPGDLQAVDNVGKLHFESGYGEVLGYGDSDYEAMGATVVSRDEALSCDVVVDVKLGDADYVKDLQKGTILFGWAHAVQSLDFAEAVMLGAHTVIAWEEIYEQGRYVFYRNREIAGEAGVLQAFRYCGRMPYDAKVAILGNGQTAKGALRVLHGLGAEVDVYPRKLEKLFIKNMAEYDVLVNCILWDTSRTDRIICRKDLARLKRGCLIIDISCDPHLEIETSHPTTINNPVYIVDGVIHYAVDNTPAMYPATVTKTLSKVISKYVDELVFGTLSESLNQAIVIQDGKIIDERIREFRTQRGLFVQ